MEFARLMVPDQKMFACRRHFEWRRSCVLQKEEGYD
jgi:hypothetical protein